MSKIIFLPEPLRNKIAAGEVVERPASVVKELVENSIDARCSSIEVEVLHGGKKLIRVSDNGEGMVRDDALASIERHATSKIASEEDLFNIETMGFRGEALSSIASVSRFSLTTTPEGSSSGVAVEVHGGDIKSVKDAASRGTSIEVWDLFFNTPARKKFLKKESTELLHIVETITQLSLSHPAIRFVMKADGQEVLNLPKSTGIRQRLIQIYGFEFIEGLVEAKKESEGLKFEAFISKPENVRATRSHQYVFVNRRPVREPIVTHALYSAYEGIKAGETHPVYFVFLDVHPGKVDFNVHPAKREVRFEDRENLYGFLKRGFMDVIKAKCRPQEAGTVIPVNVDFASHRTYGQFVSETAPLDYRAELPFIYLGETFVAFSRGGGLTVIDHHAAHERVLYEKFLKGVDLKSTQLLFPKQVELSRREHMALIGQKEMLLEFGIEVEDFGEDSVVVRALPEALLEADIRGVLADAAGRILEGIRPGGGLKEAVVARIACHASVRGSKVLTREGLHALLEDLDRAEDPDHCPHGRPTRISFSLDELKKLFKRK